MPETASITLDLAEDTLTAIAAIAARRGVSTEQFAGEVIRREAEEEAELAARIAEGRRQIAAGDSFTHEDVRAEIDRWKRERRHAA